MTLLDRLRRNKPQTQTKEEPSMPNTPTPAETLSAAQAEAENTAIHAADLKSRLLNGDLEVSAEDIDAAETRARHAGLALEAARVAYDRAHEQARRDAWAPFRDECVRHLLDDPEGELRAALDKLTPRVHAALEELTTALAEATAPVETHNANIAALAQYLGAGGYSAPEDRAAAFGETHVTIAGRGGQHLDVGSVIDGWSEQFAHGDMLALIVKRGWRIHIDTNGRTMAIQRAKW